LNRTTLVCSLLLAGATTACSSNVGDAIRPKEGTASEALGESSVGACEADYAKPLIIDISPEDRGDLEAKLKSGGPVVHFDCKSMKILPTCRMKNVKYNWVGYTPKAQLVEMESGDDLGAALPINGMSFKAALERAGRLNLATMTVGQRSAGMLAVDPDNLEGDCAKGTHVINSVWVGAFKLETGSKGEVMAAADVFGAEAHAGSKSERKAMNSDGDVKSCEGAKEDASAPPSGCTAFVRLELLKIPPKGTGPKAVSDDDHGGDAPGGPGAGPPDKEKTEKPVSCPPGRAWNGVFCAAAGPTAKAAPTCSPSNLGLCKERCTKKDGPSCYTLGSDASSKKNDADAKKFYEQACNYGDERGCSSRAFKSVMEKDEKGAIDWYSKGCFSGHASSCASLVMRYKLAKEPGKAFSSAKRACDLGDAYGCQQLGQMYWKGEGTTKDAAKGIAIFEEQCNSGKTFACERLGVELADGKNIPKDLAAAEKWLIKGCAAKFGNGGSCYALGELLDKKGDKANAKNAYDKGCDAKNGGACKKAGRPDPFGGPPGGPPGPPPPPPGKGPPPPPPGKSPPPPPPPKK
jgi:uncharacterized protein